MNEIVSSGGDVIKFAGDAIFEEWQVTPIMDEGQAEQSMVEFCSLGRDLWCEHRLYSSGFFQSSVIASAPETGTKNGRAVALLRHHYGDSWR